MSLAPFDTSHLDGLERSADRAVLGGVCAALAARYDVDVVLVRVAAILVGLGAGIGVVLYGAAWLALPRVGRQRTLLVQWWPAASSWSRQRVLTGALATAAVVAALFASAVPWSLGPAAVVLLLVLGGRRWGTSPAPRQATSAVGTSLDLPAPQATVTGPAPLPAIGAGSTAPRPAARRRRGGWLSGVSWLTVAAAVGWLAWLVGRPVWPAAAGALGLSAALAVIGLGLLVGALTAMGRPRLLVLTGLVVAMMLAVAPTRPGTMAGRTLTCTATSQAQITQLPTRLSASNVTYDLGDLRLDGTQHLTIEATASHVVIVVPQDLAVSVTTDLRGGTLTVPVGSRSDTTGGSRRLTWQQAGAGDGRLLVDATLRASTLEVRHG